MEEVAASTIDAVLDPAPDPALDPDPDPDPAAAPFPCAPIPALVPEARARLEATDRFHAAAAAAAHHLDVAVPLPTLDRDPLPETRPRKPALGHLSEVDPREASLARPVEAPETAIVLVLVLVQAAADLRTQSDADTLFQGVSVAAEAAPEAVLWAEDVTLDPCPCRPAVTAAVELAAVPEARPEELVETAPASHLSLSDVSVEAAAEAILVA